MASSNVWVSGSTSVFYRIVEFSTFTGKMHVHYGVFEISCIFFLPCRRTVLPTKESIWSCCLRMYIYAMFNDLSNSLRSVFFSFFFLVEILRVATVGWVFASYISQAVFTLLKGHYSLQVGFFSFYLQLHDRALDIVMKKLFKNYKGWCKYLGRKSSLW